MSNGVCDREEDMRWEDERERKNENKSIKRVRTRRIGAICKSI